MSYDLVFLPQPPDQSHDDTTAAERDGQRTHPDPAAWAAIVAGVRNILGEVSLREEDAYRELSHGPTGIQVSYFPRQIAVTVPYWYTGAEAAEILRAMHQIGQVVTAETGFVGYDPQEDEPLSEGEAGVEAATAHFDNAAAALSALQLRESFWVYFTGAATLADAAEKLRNMVVAKEDDQLTVRWGDDGPTMWVTLHTAPEVVAEAAALAESYELPELAKLDRRFEVSFDDLDEVLDEINTLIEVQAHLQDLTGGYVVRSWNEQLSPPEN